MSEHPATTLMHTLFAPGDWVELRSLMSGKPAAQRWVQLGTDDLREAWGTLDTDTARSHYFGANPRSGKGGARVGDVPCARCLFVDFDPEGSGAAAYANPITVRHALARIVGAALPHPTAIVRTPKGVHAYWRLEEPITELQRWEQVQKAIIQAVGSDGCVHDAPRVMRLPGFACRKPLAEGRITELVEVDAQRVYALEEFPSTPMDAASDVPRLPLDVLVPLASGREVPEHTRWVLEQATAEALHREGMKGRRCELYHQAVHLARLGWSLPDVQQVIRQAAERLGLRGFDLHDLVSRQVQNAYKHGRDNPAQRVERGAPAEEVLPWQPFPIEALPPVVREMVQAAAPSAQVDPAMAAAMAVGVLAGAIGRSRLLMLNDDFIVPPIAWVGVVAESGGGKSPCMRLMAEPLIQREKQLQAANAEALERFALEKQAHDEALAQRRKSKAPAGDPPICPKRPALPRVRVDNTTMEALVPILRDNPAGVLGLHDEMAGFIGSFDQYRKGGKGSDAPQYLRMHDGDGITVDRKGEGSTYVPVAAMSLLGGIQPGPLRRLLGPSTEHGESGMLARFMLVWPPELPARRFQRGGMAAGVKQRFGDLIGRLCDLRKGINPSAPMTVQLSDDAMRLWADFYDEHDAAGRATTGALRSALTKLGGACARLALVHHEVLVQLGTTPPGEVQAASMEAAITITRWWRHETRRIYAELHHATDLDKLVPLLEFLRKHPGSTAAEAARGIYRYRGRTADAEGDLLRLQARGQVVQVVVPPGALGGPATTRWRLAAPITITTTHTNTGESASSSDGDAPEQGEWGVR
jgi:hypothetical protein